MFLGERLEEKMSRCVRTVALVVFGTVLLLPVTEPRAAGALVDGEYDCGGGYTFRHMGTADIKGNQYRYRPYDEPGAVFAPFSVDARGRIQWGGGFGELNQPPSRIVDSKVERFGFNVMYQATSGGSINTMSCHAPGR